MKTKSMRIEKPVYIFVSPRTQYEYENAEDGLPYNFKIKDFDYGDESQVRIMEHLVEVDIPEGIDINSECIKNLEERINAVRREAKEQIAQLQDRISRLALIEYRPDNDGDILQTELGDEDDTIIRSQENPF